MSGHNKWSKIKHKKAATDAARSKVFGKIVRLIQVAAKNCDGDVNSPELRAAIEKAKEVSMPKENIDKAIKKASDGGADLQPVMFEAYGPAGVGMLITALTDNNNRTSAEIKHILSKQGGSLGSPGSVAWNFTKDMETGDWNPNTTMEIDEATGEKLERLLEVIEEQDDVQEVFVNAA
jgi:YebC/PmpR family DNA-binding regulatory protein